MSSRFRPSGGRDIGSVRQATQDSSSAITRALAGHAAGGMSRHDLKELGEHLDAGQAGLIVVGVADVGARIEEAMRNAEKIEKKHRSDRGGRKYRTLTCRGPVRVVARCGRGESS